ncbi:protein transport protein sec31-like [Penaeus monodon]|uniref:protein transport protein sec31-like n=1 Tax=Penaeus monodon TaxID=6687 RepID=UPI0018A7508F|nr:protein transport protein sec31-like [Penaeus monodon]
MKSLQVYSFLLAVTAAVVTGAPYHNFQEPDSDYLPPAKEVVVPDSDYLPPAKEVVVPDSDYLPPAKEVVVPDSDYLPPARDQNVQQEVFEEFLSNPNPSYSVSYAVEIPETRDQKQAEESLTNGVTRGSYQYLRPDGVLQVVKYVVTKEGGYQAEVEERPGFAPITQATDVKNNVPEADVTTFELDLAVAPPAGNIVQISPAHFALNHPLAPELLANANSPATPLSFTPLSIPSPAVPALPTSTFLTLPSPASEVSEIVPLSEFQKISNPVFPPPPVFPAATIPIVPKITDSQDSIQTTRPATILTNTKLPLPTIPTHPVVTKIQVPSPALFPAIPPASTFSQAPAGAIETSPALLQAPFVTFNSPHTSYTYFSK